MILLLKKIKLEEIEDIKMENKITKHLINNTLVFLYFLHILISIIRIFLCLQMTLCTAFTEAAIKK